MSDNCDKDFLFDAVVGFLTSPIWNTPVMTFVEQNSLGKVLNSVLVVFDVI